MKNTVQELAAVSGATDTSSSGISGVQGSMWLKEILKAAKQRMFFEQFAHITDIPKGHKDVTIPLNKTNKSMTNDATQTSRTYTEIDNISSVTLTPSDVKYGVIVSDTVVRTSQVDVVAFARDQLSYDMAVDIDTAIGVVIAAEGSPAATLYGGDATSTSTLEAGDILTTDLVAEGDRYLRTNGWLPEPGRPFVLFAAAVNLFALKKDSQFVNASEYGSNVVVMNGEIGNYLGIKVISTEQVPAATNWGGGANLNGHQCLMVKAKVSYGIAWSLRPRLDMEYDKELAAWKIYMDSAYGTDSLQGSAIVIIDVLDA